jgi:Kef-type K+ transport system membrane component KefB
VIPLLILLAVGGLMQAARSFSADTSIGGTELAFGFLLLASYFTAKIINRIGFPKLTGYLLAGVLAGPFVLSLVTHEMTASLKVVSNTATAVLALQAGSELELKKIKPIMRTLSGITMFAVIGAMFVLSGVLFLIRPMLPFCDGLTTVQSAAVCMSIGVALSAQSPAVVMAMLGEMRSEGPLSSVILASVVVADLTVITVFSIVLAITGALVGGSVDVAGTALEVAWELFGSMIFGVVIGVVMSQYLLRVKQGAVLFALMICVVVAEIGARARLDPLIILLATGVFLRNFSKADPSELIHSFESAQLPVFLVFFALAGSHLDIYTLVATLPVIAILAISRASSFFLGSKIACRRSAAPEVVAKYAWFGLVPQAGLALALAIVFKNTFPTFGANAKFGDQVSVVLFGVVGFNELVAPVILRAMLMRSGEAGKKKGVDFATGH